MKTELTFAEEWKDIPYYYGYQISNYGRVKSLGNKSNHKSEMLMKQSTVMGYKTIGLWKNSKGKMFKVHRLVAEAFIPNPNNLSQINHIDGDKTNNVITNLEWCTAQENVIHARKTGLIPPSKKGSNNPRSKKVFKVDPLTDEVVDTFESLHQMENETGFVRHNITGSIKRGGLAYGWKWRY